MGRASPWRAILSGHIVFMGTVSERTKCCSAGGNTTRSKTLTEPERLRLRLTGSEGGCSSAAWATTLSGASRRVRRRLGHSALLPRACCIQITPCAGWVSAEGEASPPGKESSDHTCNSSQHMCFLLHVSLVKTGGTNICHNRKQQWHQIWGREFLPV